MKRFLGSSKINTAVFISGTGSNFKNLVKFSCDNKAPIKINLVISNNSNAKGLNFAKKFKIEQRIYKYKNRSEDEKKNFKIIKKKKN